MLIGSIQYYLLRLIVKSYSFVSAMLDRSRDSVVRGIHKWLRYYHLKESEDDRDVVLLAIHDNLMSLQYASDRLRNDKSVVLYSVQKNAIALQYASDNLKDDEGVALEAIENNVMALQYASPRIRDEKYILMRAATKPTFRIACCASEKLQTDKDVALQYINSRSASISTFHDVSQKVDWCLSIFLMNCEVTKRLQWLPLRRTGKHSNMHRVHYKEIKIL